MESKQNCNTLFREEMLLLKLLFSSLSVSCQTRNKKKKTIQFSFTLQRYYMYII